MPARTPALRGRFDLAMTTTVAVLGTGIMGTGMARSLARAGLEVRAWNRSPERAAALVDDGVRVCAEASEAVSGAEVVVTMLHDTVAVLDVVAPLLDDLGGAVWLQTSTVGVEGVEQLAALAARHSVPFLDAPVLGTKAPAENGALVVVVSGDRGLEDRVRPVLDAVGSRTMWVGDSPGAASRLKLAVNAWVASVNAAVAQSVALTDALGLDPRLFLEAIGGGPTDTPYAQLKGGLMIDQSYDASFAVGSALKDVGLIQDAATTVGVESRLLDALSAVYAAAARTGHERSDMAAVREAFRPE